jgi:uncharacterized protein YraI
MNTKTRAGHHSRVQFGGVLLILLVTLFACGEAIPTPEPASELPQPAAEAVPADTPVLDTGGEEVATGIPQDVTGADGMVFRVERAELLDSLDSIEDSESYQPENGSFLVLLGRLINPTTEVACVHLQQFEIQAGDARHKMASPYLAAAKNRYEIDYPGLFLGQCLDDGEQVASYLVFDVSPGATNVTLYFDEGRAVLGAVADLAEASPAPVEVAEQSDGVADEETEDAAMDALIDGQITGLTCEKSVFMDRLAETSAFINLEQSSFADKLVVFEDGYVETEYFAHKKSLEMSARFLRDFPCLEAITVVVLLDGQQYTSRLEIGDYEAFLGVEFTELQADINNWRAFVGSVDKPLVQAFANKYVIETPAGAGDVPVVAAAPPAQSDGPMVTAADSNINIRGGPGTDYDVVGTLAVGASLAITGRNVESSWWQVETPTGMGWVAAFVVTARGTDGSIPVVEAPPLAGATETIPPAAEAGSEPAPERTASPAVGEVSPDDTD